MTKTYQTVTQMVRETAGSDDDFAEEFEKRIAGRTIVKHLSILRALRGLTQNDIAGKFGCTQGRISKLESSADEDLRLGELAQYASSLGFHVHIALQSKTTTPVHRVKQLAFRIKHELDGLAGLAKTDHKIAQAVSLFFGEALFNLVKILQDSAGKLPRKPEDGTPYITFEFCQEIQEEVTHQEEEQGESGEEQLLAIGGQAEPLVHA